MKDKFSKGKWSANGLYIMIEGMTGAQGQAFVQDIPRAENKFKEDEEALANARLMAASKTMLETLRGLRTLNLHLYKEGTVGSRVYKEIQEAIKEATGETD